MFSTFVNFFFLKYLYGTSFHNLTSSWRSSAKYTSSLSTFPNIHVNSDQGPEGTELTETNIPVGQCRQEINRKLSITMTTVAMVRG